MPDTTPLPLPECPREDCPATIDHRHGASGASYACARQIGESCLCHVGGERHITRCYAPRTQPAPDEDERIAAWAAIAAHPIFAPCYATAAPLLLSMLDRLDGLDAQPAPQPPAVDPADVRVGDRVQIVIEGVVILTPDHRLDAADLVGLLGDDDFAQSVYLLHREPEDPRAAVVRRYYDDAGIGSSDDGIRDLLARLDAMGADQ